MTHYPLNHDGTTYEVCGVGNAIMDILAHVDDAFLTEGGMIKGITAVIDAQKAKDLQARMTGSIECSGGSVANTVAAIASLGGKTVFMGRVHDDAMGLRYRDDLRRTGVAFEVLPASEGASTACCYVCVTPDGERTMNTYLGACGEFEAEDVEPDLIARSVVTYLEGYLWYQPVAKAAIEKAITATKAAGRTLAITLSDPFCVQVNRDAFLAVLDRTHIVFANEDEAKTLAGTDALETAADFLGDKVDLAVITCGAQGALIRCGGAKLNIPAQRVAQVTDQTGAGDLFAAGFLHGITQGKSLEDAAKLGHACAATIITQLGARAKGPLVKLVA